MSTLSWLATTGGVASFALGLTVWVMKLRIDGLHLEVKGLVRSKKTAEAALKVATTEFDQYRGRAEAKEASLLQELERYENQELDGIEAEPDRAVRIARRRQWVSGVLSKASAD